MPLPVEVIGEIACCGESHRLLATREGLRLLDHQDEATQVFDVLSDGSPCTWVRAAWLRLLDRHLGSDRDDRLYIGVVEMLLPDRDGPGIYPDQLSPGDTRMLLGLTSPLRYALALQFLDRSLAADGIRDLDRATRLREATSLCWDDMVLRGRPTPAARRRLVAQVRSSEAR